MKNIIRKIIVFKLKLAAKILLMRKRPSIIAITGSAGKTSTKEFISTLLSTDYNILASQEGYNTEIGAPLALFSKKVPKKLFSLKAWFVLLLKVYKKALFARNFPEKVIVEMGADHPGDIKYLTSIFIPDMAVVLTVLPVHLADFKNIQAIAAEKSELVKAVKTRGKVFLNSDDKLVAEMARGAKGQVIYFGSKEGANYQFQRASSTLNGLEFDLLIEGKRDHFKVRLYGEHMIYPIVAAIAVAHEAGITVQRIKEGLREITPYKGRMNILEGVKDSIIIDDTYNANPRSMIGALEFLSMQKGRKIALLGNMNELGDFEREGHEMVGRKVAEVADMLVTVGELAKKYIAAEAEKSGLAPEKIISFTDSKEAGKWLKKRLREGDIILAKGSQNKVRMERAVEEILKNPKEARKVLVRQSAFWKERV